MGKLDEWLESEEGRKTLSKIARSIVQGLNSRKLFFTFADRDQFGRHINDDLIEDIRSELALCLLEKRTDLEKRIAFGNRNCSHYLQAVFMNHMKDRAAGPDKDPRRHLYKRAATVLRENNSFYTLSIGKGRGAFSMEKDNVTVPPFSRDDMAAIPFPYETISAADYDSINKKKVLAGLAEHFWRQAGLIWGKQSIWVYVKDFVAWLSGSVPMTMPSSISAPCQDVEGHDTVDLFKDETRRPDKEFFDPTAVKRWAGNFAGRLNDKEKAVFYLREEEKLSFQKIAARLGWKGASGTKYQHAKVLDMMRAFLRDLPWLSYDEGMHDLNEEAFFLFFQTLLSHLKKSVPDP